MCRVVLNLELLTRRIRAHFRRIHRRPPRGDPEGERRAEADQGVEPLPQNPLVGNEIDEHTQWRNLEVARVADRIWG
jgi:hypothetical protein